MKLLILSYKDCDWNNTPSKAIYEYANGTDTEVFFGYCSSTNTPIKDKIFTGVKKCIPSFNDVINKNSGYKKSSDYSKIIPHNLSDNKKLIRFVESNGIQAVICGDVFSMKKMTHIKNVYKTIIPSYGIISSYSVIPFLNQTNLDAYFVPNEDVRHELLSYGIPPENIYITGIPVSEELDCGLTREEARNYLFIQKVKQVYLIVGTGLRERFLINLLNEFYTKALKNSAVYILCDRDSGIREKIVRIFGLNSIIKPVIFSRSTGIYMKASDVILTKPGGLSVTGAGLSGTPIVMLPSSDNQDIGNAKFFTSKGMSFFAHDEKEAVSYANQILSDRTLYGKIMSNLKFNLISDSAKKILTVIKGKIIKKNI